MILQEPMGAHGYLWCSPQGGNTQNLATAQSCLATLCGWGLLPHVSLGLYNKRKHRKCATKRGHSILQFWGNQTMLTLVYTPDKRKHRIRVRLTLSCKLHMFFEGPEVGKYDGRFALEKRWVLSTFFWRWVFQQKRVQGKGETRKGLSICWLQNWLICYLCQTSENDPIARICLGVTTYLWLNGVLP